MFNIYTQQIRNDVIIKEQMTHNLITVEGAEYMLRVAVALNTGPQVDFPMFVFYIDNLGYTGISRLDTFDSHAGWIEWKDYRRESGSDLREQFGGGITQETTSNKVGDFNTDLVTERFAFASSRSCANIKGFGIIGNNIAVQGADKDNFLFPLVAVAEYDDIFCLLPFDILKTRYSIRLQEG